MNDTQANAVTHTREYRLLPGVVRYTFIIFGLFTTPNLCPLTQNPGDATDHLHGLLETITDCILCRDNGRIIIARQHKTRDIDIEFLSAHLSSCPRVHCLQRVETIPSGIAPSFKIFGLKHHCEIPNSSMYIQEDIRAKSPFILETIQDRPGYYESLIESHRHPIEPRHFR